MSEKTYNGWTNYETWAVNLWLTNDEGSYNYWREAAGWAKADNEKLATYSLAERLKKELNEQMPELNGMWFDLLNAALSDVDWHEIARHMIAEVAEEEG